MEEKEHFQIHSMTPALLLLNASLCTNTQWRQTIPKHWSLKPKEVDCRAMQRDEWLKPLKSCELPKGIQQRPLIGKVREGCAWLLQNSWCLIFCSCSCSHGSQCSSHSIFSWPFTPTEGLPNSWSDTASPSLPVCWSACPCTYSASWNSPDSPKQEAVCAALGVPDAAAAFSSSPPPQCPAGQALLRNCSRQGDKQANGGPGPTDCNPRKLLLLRPLPHRPKAMLLSHPYYTTLTPKLGKGTTRKL